MAGVLKLGCTFMLGVRPARFLENLLTAELFCPLLLPPAADEGGSKMEERVGVKWPPTFESCPLFSFANVAWDKAAREWWDRELPATFSFNFKCTVLVDNKTMYFCRALLNLVVLLLILNCMMILFLIIDSHKIPISARRVPLPAP